MDLNIPVLADTTSAKVTCDFENTLVYMVKDSEAMPLEDRARLPVVQILKDLYDDQEVEIHILTDRTPASEATHPGPSVVDYCARMGLPIAEVHYTGGDPEIKLSILKDLQSIMHLDDAKDFVVNASKQGWRCVLVGGDELIDDEIPEDESTPDLLDNQMDFFGEYIPENGSLPGRSTPRSNVTTRLMYRNAALMNPAATHALPLLEDVTELVITLNNVLIHLAQSGAGKCLVCDQPIDGEHTPSGDTICWVEELNDLMKAYTTG